MRARTTASSCFVAKKKHNFIRIPRLGDRFASRERERRTRRFRSDDSRPPWKASSISKDQYGAHLLIITPSPAQPSRISSVRLSCPRRRRTAPRMWTSPGCPRGWLRDEWFVLEAYNASDASTCVVPEVLMGVFLPLLIAIFLASVLLTALALAFNRKTRASQHLAFNLCHATAGATLLLGSVARDDFIARDNPAFLALFAAWAGGVMAHSLALTAQMRTIAKKTGPRDKGPSTGVSAFFNNAAVQILAIRTAFVLTAIAALGYVLAAASAPWGGDAFSSPFSEWRRSRDFFWFLGCILLTLAAFCFMFVPIVHSWTVYGAMRETRRKLLETQLVTSSASDPLDEESLQTRKSTVGSQYRERKLSRSEVVRRRVYELEQKMLHSVLLACTFGVIAPIVLLLASTSKIVGPRYYFMLFLFAAGFAVDFFVVNLYFPLHNIATFAGFDSRMCCLRLDKDQETSQ